MHVDPCTGKVNWLSVEKSIPNAAGFNTGMVQAAMVETGIPICNCEINNVETYGVKIVLDLLSIVRSLYT